MKKEISKFVGSRIKSLRVTSKLTQKELGEKIGVKHNTISSYENGTNEPEQDTLYRIANILNVSINDFFPYNEELVKNVSSNYNYYPTAISAGLPFKVDGITESEKITVPDMLMGRWAGQDDVFLANINGESMNNIIKDGSLIAIKPIELNSLKNGDVVVFSENHEYSVKHFHKDGDKLIFKANSNNPNYYDQTFSQSDNVKIHGKVIMWTITQD